ncbi:CPBP family intramembrane metalloprotease [Fructobacillus sp. M158]|uniref:CPBP family intramembrane glutamic endopeptidase n=1 Tax=Fructobacillus parabroussonetiae TaxID=2713174 RepID=UPI00200B8E32|nr:type II CAAX endopeptidase family protein [Fructobacillus parabroussonetiae]MCK8617984.1 CPBP family intramembrane metalloprotease [Fructobacillus parabroussonetiae]
MKNKKINGFFYALILFIVFTIIDVSLSITKIPNQEFFYSLGRFVFSLIVVYLFFKTMKTDKIFKERLYLSKKNKFLTFLLVLIAIFIYFVLNNGINQIITILSKDFIKIMATVMMALSAGIFEEYLTRGFLFQSFLKLFNNNKLIISSVLSSLIFGFLHLYNAFDMGLNTTLQQVFYATAIGLLFAALRIAFNGLILTVGLHSLIDFQLNLLSSSNNPVPWSVIIIIFTPIAIISLLATYLFEKEYKISMIPNNL